MREGGRSASTNMAAVAVCLLLMTVFGVPAVFSGLVGPEDEADLGVSMSGGVIRAQPGSSLHLRLYGSGLQNDTWPWVTVGDPAGKPCFTGPDSHMRLLHEFSVGSEQSGLITLQGMHTDTGKQGLLQPLCTCNGGSILTLQGKGVEEKPPWPEGDPQQQCPLGSPSSKSQDSSTTAQGQQILASWLLAFLIVLFVLLSGLLRGLQVSTLALEAPELGLLRDWGTPSERLNASRLDHLRTRWGGFTLISLLALCCITNSAVAVLLYNATGSIVVAIFAAAAMLLLAGEALPAAICSRWGPWLASKSLWLTHIFILIISPVSFPLSWLLELVFRQDPSCCRLRLRILEMARCGDPYSELVRDEFSKGALRNRTVEDILTPVNECFMLPSDALLDFTTMSKIMESGYTRIPVYENERSNIVDILYVKDLAFVDPDDCTPLSTITRFYSHPVHFVFSDTKLDAVLEEFKKGKSHLAIVQKVNNEGEGDPFYEVMGLVTLEDVIEEIIKSEILDESEDFKRKVKKKRPPLEPILIPRGGGDDISFFKTCEADQKVKISPQLLLSTQRFLSQEVELFSTSHVSEKVLLHLLKLPGVTQEVKFDESDHFSAEHYLYLRSQPVDYFILILQGQVQVEIGKENLRFENGAFTYYGVAALSTNIIGHHSGGCERNESPDSGLYCPDYTVRAMSDLQIVKVSRLQYLNALRSSNPHTNSQSPDSIELKILPNSQTQLLNSRNTDSGTQKEGVTDLHGLNPGTQSKGEQLSP